MAFKSEYPDLGWHAIRPCEACHKILRSQPFLPGKPNLRICPKTSFLLQSFHTLRFDRRTHSN